MTQLYVLHEGGYLSRFNGAVHNENTEGLLCAPHHLAKDAYTMLSCQFNEFMGALCRTNTMNAMPTKGG